MEGAAIPELKFPRRTYQFFALGKKPEVFRCYKEPAQFPYPAN